VPHENIRVLGQKREGGRIGPSIDPGRDGVVEGPSETSPALEDL